MMHKTLGTMAVFLALGLSVQAGAQVYTTTTTTTVSPTTTVNQPYVPSYGQVDVIIPGGTVPDIDTLTWLIDFLVGSGAVGIDEWEQMGLGGLIGGYDDYGSDSDREDAIDAEVWDMSGLGDELGDYDDYADDDERADAIGALEWEQSGLADELGDYDDYADADERQDAVDDLEESQSDDGDDGDDGGGDGIMGNDQPLPFPGLWGMEASFRVDTVIVARLESMIEAQSLNTVTYVVY